MGEVRSAGTAGIQGLSPPLSTHIQDFVKIAVQDVVKNVVQDVVTNVVTAQRRINTREKGRVIRNVLIKEKDMVEWAKQLDTSLTLTNILNLLEYYACNKNDIMNKNDVMIIRLYSAMLLLIGTAIEQGDSVEKCDDIIEMVNDELFNYGYRVIISFNTIYD